MSENSELHVVFGVNYGAGGVIVRELVLRTWQTPEDVGPSFRRTRGLRIPARGSACEHESGTESRQWRPGRLCSTADDGAVLLRPIVEQPQGLTVSLLGLLCQCFIRGVARPGTCVARLDWHAWFRTEC